MSKTYDLAVFCGRFGPPHRGHEKVIKEALQHAENVLILEGSAWRPRTTRNPLIFNERAFMMKLLFPENNVIVKPLRDFTYNDQEWMAEVQSIVNETLDEINGKSVALIGFEKDHTSYYINMFPQWGSISVQPYMNTVAGGILDASWIRKQLFEGNLASLDSRVLDSRVLEFIRSLDLSEIVKEYHFIEAYKKQFDFWPYPDGPIHHTVDAVVIQSGHVLLVRRKSYPGKGLYALPGGHLNYNETLMQGAIRELVEETKLKVPEKVLIGSVAGHQTFDDPHRSTRGRTITDAFKIELENGPLPKVKGSDDADKAFWLPLAELNSENMFEDHYDIIQVMTGKRERRIR